MPATVIPVSGILLGFVGQISNEGLSLRTPRAVQAADTNNINFGETLVLNGNNTYSSMKQAIVNGLVPTITTPFAIAASNVHTNVNFPAAGGSNLSAGFYTPGQVADALVQGTINVVCGNGTPTAGGTVYLRKVANGAFPNSPVGALDAVADGTNTVALNPLLIAWKTGIIGTDGTAQVCILVRMIP